jgi:hypothetical protein
MSTLLGGLLAEPTSAAQIFPVSVVALYPLLLAVAFAPSLFAVARIRGFYRPLSAAPLRGSFCGYDCLSSSPSANTKMAL